MICSWFSPSGHVISIPLLERRTVNAKWYTEVCLPKLFESVEEKRPARGIRGLRLHQDNASSHTAHITMAFLEEKGVKLVAHPPYSPDLAPCDFIFFPKAKESLKGQRFRSAEEAVTAFHETISTWPKETFRNAFHSWFQRMKSCIHANGDYFEKK